MANKQTSKSTKTKRRFDLANKKVQFFVVIGIIAILGGGYYTLKSFADSVVYSLGPGQIKIDSNYGPCSAVRGSDPGKNISSTLDIRCNKQVPNNITLAGNQPRLTGNFKTCLTVKGSGKLRLDTYATATKLTYRDITNDGAYHTYCSETVWSNNATIRSLVSFVGPTLSKVTKLELVLAEGQTPTPTLGK